MAVGVCNRWRLVGSHQTSESGCLSKKKKKAERPYGNPCFRVCALTRGFSGGNCLRASCAPNVSMEHPISVANMNCGSHIKRGPHFCPFLHPRLCFSPPTRPCAYDADTCVGPPTRGRNLLSASESGNAVDLVTGHLFPLAPSHDAGACMPHSADWRVPSQTS